MCPRSYSPWPRPSLVCVGGTWGRHWGSCLCGGGVGIASWRPTSASLTATVRSQEVEDEEAPDYENLQLN